MPFESHLVKNNGRYYFNLTNELLSSENNELVSVEVINNIGLRIKSVELVNRETGRKYSYRSSAPIENGEAISWSVEPGNYQVLCFDVSGLYAGWIKHSLTEEQNEISLSSGHLIMNTTGYDIRQLG